ncbi:MAG: ACP S-malonyltransferase [Chloroflexi bacterium]|nr:ACP S-malonyltransferase [Chloroflexota bacterium]
MTETGRVALVFPGQGCQSVGMGADLYQRFPEARAVYERADEALGFPLSRLCFEGPAGELDDTANTQPAIYTTTLALWAVLAPRCEGIRSRIAYAAGHSLGEFCALAVAGAFGLEEGLRLVRLRGEAMRDAGAEAPGGMAAIIGLSDKAVGEIVAEANGDREMVWIANLNSPGQVVIAGENEALARALELAKARQARRALPLAVSVACHTPLMKSAAQHLGAALEAMPFQRPWAPVVSNALAAPLSEPEDIKAALVRQLTSPVRWVESVQLMAAQGATTMLEIGPKAVVSGLIKRIRDDVALWSVTDAASLEAFDGEALR